MDQPDPIDLDHKAQAIRLATLLDEWEHSGNRVRVRCARDIRNALNADDVLGGFVRLIHTNNASNELDELRALARTVETIDFGGYTQRDADAFAVTMYAAGYRRRAEGQQ